MLPWEFHQTLCLQCNTGSKHQIAKGEKKGKNKQQRRKQKKGQQQQQEKKTNLAKQAACFHFLTPKELWVL